MKRLLLAIAGYALYRWWTSQSDRQENGVGAHRQRPETKAGLTCNQLSHPAWR